VSRVAAAAVTVIAVALGLGAAATAAVADALLPPGSVRVEVLDAAGNPDTQAGSHPARMITRLAAPKGPDGLPEVAKVQIVEFPTGMAGDPNGASQCPREVYDDLNGGECPPETQVGTLTSVESNGASATQALFNLEPAPGEVASFGTAQYFFHSKFSARLRASDFALETRTEGTPEIFPEEPVVENRLEFWGVPADHLGASLLRRPFLTNPTRCSGPIEVSMRMLTWQRPDEWRSGSGSTGLPLTGCDKLAFAPALALGLENPVADSPTGISLETVFPSTADPDSTVSSQARSSHVTLPDGLAFSAGAASRLTVCTDAEAAVGSDKEADCPPASKVGTIEIGMSALAQPLRGNLYIGAEHPGERFRVFAIASSSDGIETKFVSAMRPDPATGQLTANIDDLPQVPFEYLLMHFDGGPRGLLVAPLRCGAATARGTFVPYSGGAPASAASSVAIAPRPGHRCGDPLPFQPSLRTAISARRAGQPTSFAMILGRQDGEQLTDRFSFDLPQGLSASLGAVDRCPEAAIAAARCPASSRVGSAFVEIGSGSSTAELSGGAYLTGPYRRAPFGFALILDAKLGPFDLGALTVRSAMRLNPLTGRVTVQGDPMPQAFEGVPVRFQQIGLTMDRRGFMRTPTSCDPMHVAATIRSTEGAVASPENELSVGGCVDLPFEPKLGVALTGRSQLHKGGRPGLRLSIGSHEGDANMRSMAMSLPPGLRMSGSGLSALCARRQAVRGKCPKGSKVGLGFGRTSLLPEPMKGTVYLAQPEDGDGEPDLWTHLEGEGVELNLHSTSELEHGRVVSRFEDLPDMSLSTFTMQLTGGKHGVLVLDRGVCQGGQPRRLRAPAEMEAQNGAQRAERLRVKTPDGCRAG
jgi:hypothetical protein